MTSEAHAGTENSVRLIYGGNVNLSNCREIPSVNGIDGLFVGGAAADPAGFISVIGRALDGAANQADFARELYLRNREKEERNEIARQEANCDRRG